MQNRNAAYCLFEPKPPRTPRLSFALKDRQGARGETPLDQLLEQALAVLNPKGRSVRFQSSWLARAALRAVCEAIVADNCLTLPVRIDRPYRRAGGSEVSFDFGDDA